MGHNVNAGINAEWTIFDGYKIQTNYQRLQELKLQSATQTRMAIEDYIAELVSEYYNYVQQYASATCNMPFRYPRKGSG